MRQTFSAQVTAWDRTWLGTLLSRKQPSAAPGGSRGLACVSASQHTFCKGPRLRKINPQRIERIERIERIDVMGQNQSRHVRRV
jgi:hypothetical protein